MIIQDAASQQPSIDISLLIFTKGLDFNHNYTRFDIIS